jgi:hypothetical protein
MESMIDLSRRTRSRRRSKRRRDPGDLTVSIKALDL